MWLSDYRCGETVEASWVTHSFQKLKNVENIWIGGNKTALGTYEENWKREKKSSFPS